MQLPVIHMNGTSRDSLVEDLCKVSHVLNDAYEAMKQACPNGRDYYPLGPGAIRQAESEHLDRLRRVDAVKSEIDAMTLAIADMANNRNS